jgi:hypothetical protein
LYLLGLGSAALVLVYFAQTGTSVATPSGSFRLSALLPFALAGLALRFVGVLSGRQSEARLMRILSWIPPASFFALRPNVLSPQLIAVIGAIFFLDVFVQRPGLGEPGKTWRPTKKAILAALVFIGAGYAATTLLPAGTVVTKVILFLTLLGASVVLWLSRQDNLTKPAATLYLFSVLFFTLFLANSLPYGPLAEWGLIIIGLVSALQPALAGTREAPPPLIPQDARAHVQRLEVKTDQQRALSDALVNAYVSRGTFATEIGERVAASMTRLGRAVEGERLRSLILAEAKRGKKRRAHLMTEITRIIQGSIQVNTL